MVCEHCKKRVKDWEGDAPICAFTKTGIFTNDNWRCALLDELRDLIDEDQEIFNKYTEDRLVPIPIKDGYLLIGWYKQRGKVDFLTIVSGFDRIIVKPSYKDMVKITNEFRKNIQKNR